MKPLILASGSPRRAKILRDLGIDFEIVKTDADETAIPDDPVRTVTTNALAKLRAAAGAVDAQRSILAADTIVWFADRIYGKPCDLDEAKEFLRELSGQTHSVFTGVAFRAEDGTERTACAESRVTFRVLTEEAIADYVARVLWLHTPVHTRTSWAFLWNRCASSALACATSYKVFHIVPSDFVKPDYFCHNMV